MKIINFFFAIFFCANALAQKDSSVANTAWKGVFYIPSYTESVLTFSKDTLKLYAGEAIIEVMTYKQKKDTLFINKIDGMSPCGNEELFTWKITMNGVEAIISVLNDDCSARRSSLMDNTVFTRYKAKMD